MKKFLITLLILTGALVAISMVAKRRSESGADEWDTFSKEASMRTSKASDAVTDAAKEAASKVTEAAKEAATKVADATKEAATKVTKASKDAASSVADAAKNA